MSLTTEQEQILQVWLDGEASADEREQAKELLKDPAAAQWLKDQQRLRELLRAHALPEVGSPVFDSIKDKLPEPAPVHEMPMANWKTLAIGGAAAAAVALAVIFVPGKFKNDDDVDTKPVAMTEGNDQIGSTAGDPSRAQPEEPSDESHVADEANKPDSTGREIKPIMRRARKATNDGTPDEDSIDGATTEKLKKDFENAESDEEEPNHWRGRVGGAPPPAADAKPAPGTPNEEAESDDRANESPAEKQAEIEKSKSRKRADQQNGDKGASKADPKNSRGLGTGGGSGGYGGEQKGEKKATPPKSNAPGNGSKGESRNALKKQDDENRREGGGDRDATDGGPMDSLEEFADSTPEMGMMAQADVLRVAGQFGDAEVMIETALTETVEVRLRNIGQRRECVTALKKLIREQSYNAAIEAEEIILGLEADGRIYWTVRVHFR